MHKLYELKEMLCDELDKYGDKRDLTAGSLDVVDKLAHAAKNVEKLIEAEEGYSNRYMPDYGYSDGMSRARRRDSMGRYSRYSRDGLADKLRELMESAPDERSRDEIKRLADKMDSM